MSIDQRLKNADEIELLCSQGMTYAEIAEKLGIAESTVWRRRDQGRKIRRKAAAKTPVIEEKRELPSFDRWDLPEPQQFEDLIYDQSPDDVPIEELIESRKQRYEQIDRRKRKRHTQTVKVNLRGPIAVVHFGDPHVDDDSCNWHELLRNVETVSRTPGMFAANIGDVTNNWVGRLMKCYAHQTTTLDDAVRLAHWLFHSVPWLYFVLGNHDKWNQGAQLLKYLTQGAKIAVMAANTARVNLEFPEGDPIRIVARHDFKGSSIWNLAHGPMRESKLNNWGDIYVQGHRHSWVSHHEEGTDGKPRWSIMVRGFKQYDSYAEELGFYEHKHGSSCTTILDPTHKVPTERIKVVWDVEEAADILRWKRQKYGVNVKRFKNPLG